MAFLIRDAVAEDRERVVPLQQEIAQLHHDARPDLMRPIGRFFTEESFRERLSSPDHTVLVAETESGQVVGYAFAWVIRHRDHSTYIDFDSYYIDDICVLKSQQRNGVGKALFDSCVQRAKAFGCRNLELGVWSFNRGAIAFYEACGMTERLRRMEMKLED